MNKSITLRLDLDKADHKRVYDYLQGSELSINKEVVHTICDYLDLMEERKNDKEFLDRVVLAVHDSLKPLVPLLNLLSMVQPVAQVQRAVPVQQENSREAEENMMDFLDSFG